MTYRCVSCDETLTGQPIAVRDMMFAPQQFFHYVECGRCSTLQLPEVPSDLSAHYPQTYYSFKSDAQGAAPASGLLRWAKRQRTAHNLGRGSLIGRLLQRLAPSNFAFDWGWFRQAGVGLDASILDVGCGSGTLLRELRNNGFSQVSGIDPFIAADVCEPGLTILKTSIDRAEGRHDLVMFHHSLEHVENPREVLRHARRLLHDAGRLVIRIPITGTYAWRQYRENWVQIDAPRHLFIPTETSMIAMAAEAGFRCTSVAFDSRRLMLLGSELYARGLPLYEADGRFTFDDENLFDEAARQAFERLTAQLNLQKDADQACFHFAAAG